MNRIVALITGFVLGLTIGGFGLFFAWPTLVHADTPTHKTVFVGHSELYFMYNYQHDKWSQYSKMASSGLTAKNGKELWVCRSGAYYGSGTTSAFSFKNTLLPNASKKIKPGDTVVIDIGANDGNSETAKSYVSLVKKYMKKKNWKNCKVYMTTQISNYELNMTKFNSKLMKAAKDSKIKIIKVNKYCKSKGYNMRSYWTGGELKSTPSKNVYKFILSKT